MTSNTHCSTGEGRGKAGQSVQDMVHMPSLRLSIEHARLLVGQHTGITQETQHDPQCRQFCRIDPSLNIDLQGEMSIAHLPQTRAEKTYQ